LGLSPLSESGAREAWGNLSPKGYELRDELIHAYRYGYRNVPAIQQQVDEIEEGSTHDDMLLDLGKLGKIGLDNPAELTAIKFPTTKVELAMQYSDELATLYTEATIGDLGSHPKKIARDVAYADLKAIMDEIYDAGQYLFWKDPVRKKLYVSEYKSSKNRKAYARLKEREQIASIEL